MYRVFISVREWMGIGFIRIWGGEGMYAGCIGVWVLTEQRFNVMINHNCLSGAWHPHDIEVWNISRGGEMVWG